MEPDATGVRKASDFPAFLPSKGRSTSTVWQFFMIKSGRAVCIICRTSYIYRESTALLRKHLTRVHSIHAEEGKPCENPAVNRGELLRMELQKGQTTLPTTWSALNPTQPMAVYCVACETKFLDQPSLEDHVCPAAIFICTCGTGFAEYPEMLVHRNGHHDLSSLQTGQRSIKQRTKETELQKMKLQIMMSIDKKLSAPMGPPAPPIGLVPPRSGDTVDLGPRFQPVVLLTTTTKFHHGNKYVCGTCRMGFWDVKCLVKHVATHSARHLYGCQCCGLLLIGDTPPNSTHFCGFYQAGRRERFTTGLVTGGDLAQTRGVWRCPHCPMIYYKPWFLIRHVKKCPHAAQNNKMSACCSESRKCDAKRSKCCKMMQNALSCTVPALAELGKVVFKTPGDGVAAPRVLLGDEVDEGTVAEKSQEDASKPRSAETEVAATQSQPRSTETEIAATQSQPRSTETEIAATQSQPRSTETEVATLRSTPMKEYRCPVCGKSLKTIQMLGNHRCRKKLPSLKRGQLPRSAFKYTNGYRHSIRRPAPYSLSERDSGGMVTVRLQTSHNVEPLLTNDKGEATTLSCAAVSRSIGVQTKVEFDDGSYNGAFST